MANIPAFPGLSGNAADEALRRAQAALAQDRPAEAERIAADVLKANPRHAAALEILGGALLLQGRAPEAIEALEQAGRGRHDPKLDTQLAIALRQTGRDKEALTKLKRAVKRRPAYAPAFHELGFLLHHLGRYDEAVEVLREGIAAAPMMIELSIQLGNVCAIRNDRAGAVEAFSRALALAPDSIEAIAGLGNLLYQNGDYAPAAEHIRHSLRFAPDQPDLWIKLGVCLIETGDAEAGTDCLRTAARAGPEMLGKALNALASAGHGRFWLRPSDAVRFLRGGKS